MCVSDRFAFTMFFDLSPEMGTLLASCIEVTDVWRMVNVKQHIYARFRGNYNCQLNVNSGNLRFLFQPCAQVSELQTLV